MSRPGATTALVLVGCALLAACGSTGQPSGTGTGTASAAQGGKSRDLEFSNCMRSHGVTNFPDPPATGLQLPVGVNAQSPAFKSAQQACKQFEPDNGPPPATSARDRTAALAFARCMRSDGVPEFPDPSFSPPTGAPRILFLRGVVFAMPASVDPKSPAFRRAARACGVGLT
jgi:hypothetical protein